MGEPSHGRQRPRPRLHYTTRSGHYAAPYTRSAPHSSLTPGHEARSTSRRTSLSSHPSTPAAAGVTRDSHGRIKRSETARLDFGAPPCNDYSKDVLNRAGFFHSKGWSQETGNAG